MDVTDLLSHFSVTNVSISQKTDTHTHTHVIYRYVLDWSVWLVLWNNIWDVSFKLNFKLRVLVSVCVSLPDLWMDPFYPSGNVAVPW